MRFVLASASPRRKELLALLGLEFDVRPADIDEAPGRSQNPLIVARRLAREKAEAARLLDHDSPIIAADTVVAFAGELLAKPRDAEEAWLMLRKLRGQTHEVVTAVALMPPKRRSILGRHPLTRVTMRDYPDSEIEAWIAGGGPFDRAGGVCHPGRRLQPGRELRGLLLQRRRPAALAARGDASQGRYAGKGRCRAAAPPMRFLPLRPAPLVPLPPWRSRY